MQKIGVFVCWCGSNIAATVDVKAVAEAARKVPGVVFSADYQYMCSEAGQGLIKDAIKELKADPLMYEVLGDHTFHKYVEAKEIEWDKYRCLVTPWELDTYITK